VACSTQAVVLDRAGLRIFSRQVSHQHVKTRPVSGVDQIAEPPGRHSCEHGSFAGGFLVAVVRRQDGADPGQRGVTRLAAPA
jgi:hypothetical protein